MAFLDKNRVTFSADRKSYLEWDDGNNRANLYANGTKVAELLSDGTATASSSAATLSRLAGKITSEALTTAQNAIETITLTNTEIAAADMVFASVANGTNTQGTPMIGEVNPGAGSCTIQVINKHATAEALNGTVEISFHVVKAA